MLNTATVKAARPAARPYKIHDGGGLHVLVRPTGTKTLRFKYRRGGKEQLLTIGTFPEVSLVEARIRRDRAREQLAQGVDIEINGAAEAPATFEQLAREWHAERQARWSAVHAADVLASLERDVFPAIGGEPIADLDERRLLKLLKDVERRGTVETARRLRQRISGVFRFAQSGKLVDGDPAAAIADELSPRPLQKPQPALLELAAVQQLLADVDALPGAAIVKLASQLLALTAVRMTPLRFAEWREIEELDGPAPRWRIPPGKMKLDKRRKGDAAAEHVILLSRQAAEILRQLHALTGPSSALGVNSRWLFPGRKAGQPIGEGAIGALYAAAGYGGRHVPHGWRASFSTILNDEAAKAGRSDDRALIDRALAHVAVGKVEGAYNRARHVEQLGIIFQRWADLLLPSSQD